METEITFLEKFFETCISHLTFYSLKGTFLVFLTYVRV